MDSPSNSPIGASASNKQGAVEDDRPKRARKTKRIVEQVELSKELKHCQRVLVSLLSHRYASPFAAPVDAVRLNIPDYYTVIKNPMDFGTIKEKLTSGGYESVDQFHRDIELVFANCETYNPPESEIVAVYVKTLRDVYTSAMAPLVASMKAEAAAAAAAAAVAASPVPAPLGAAAELEDTERKRVKKRKTEHKQSTPSTPATSTGAVPYNEKVRLARAISSLKEVNLGPVIDILLRYREIDPETSVVKDEVVVDLDSVSNDALRELSTYVYSLVSRPEI